MSKNNCRSIYEYILHIYDIADLFLAICYPLYARDQIDDLLQGLHVEHNPLIMMIYIKGDLTDIYNVDGVLYVQEAQVEKYK